MFCILNIAVFRPACGEVVEWSKAHAWKACVRLRVPRVRIPPSPPNRVAFEPAALLFLYQGCCRHHNRHRSLRPAIVGLLLDTEKRCTRQLYKINTKNQLSFNAKAGKNYLLGFLLLKSTFTTLFHLSDGKRLNSHLFLSLSWCRCTTGIKRKSTEKIIA